jgi:transcriptional regulator with XRE-family HTH domain
MDLFEYVGGRIRELRTRYGGGKGLSQEALAKELHVVPNTISRWETATYRPSLADLQRLAQFFGVSILEFFPREEETPEDERLAALLRAAKQLKPQDQEELRRYAEFRRARYRLEQGGKVAAEGRRKSEK